MSRWIPVFVAAALVVCGVRPDPLSAQENPHGILPEGMDCAACHTPAGWAPARDTLDFTHGATSGFGLSGAHATTTCASCHVELRFDGPSVEAVDCAGCHVDVHEGQFLDDCASCHDTDGFDDIDGELVHSRTALPLSGAHIELTCESCHADEGRGVYGGLETDCAACHRDAFEGAVSVDHVAGGYPTDCTQCHTDLGWTDAPTFDHVTASSGFPLLGAHVEVQCASCHVVPGMASLFATRDANACVVCHQADFDRDHPGSSFTTDCTVCHTVDSWPVPGFDHGLTGFELLGSHAPLDCADCHTDGHRGLRWSPEEQNDCVACHQSDYDEEHTGTGFPLDCVSCHTVDDWEDAEFDHGDTAFPLVGTHADEDCTTCHGPGGVLVVPTPSSAEDCVSCHQEDYDDEHTGSGFPSSCLDCHNQVDWDDATVNHPSLANGFELLGRHAAVECASCHTVPEFGLHFSPPAGQNDCVVCHQAEYDAEHTGTGFPTDCVSCHNEATWEGATFDHADTGFPLVEAHDRADCSTCHGEGGTLVVPTPASADDCVSCHQADYDGEHAGSGLPTTCLDCHTQTTWEGATFDHASTGFPLLGAHDRADCSTCHGEGGILVVPTPASAEDCVSCHQTDYDGEHAGSGLPTTCLDCHTQTTWEGATFDHASTGFPLLGAHDQADCSTCHGEGGTLVVPMPAAADDCVACHQVEYDGQHAGSGLPTTCLDCHTQTTWKGATFDHTSLGNGFALIGRHAAAECSSCHTIPGYTLHTGTPATQDDCLACHQVDYDAEHAASQYPLTCLVCHDQIDWRNSSYDHDAQYFPIYSGKHRTEWGTQCSTCHTVPTDFSSFTCTDCHEHRKSKADDQHKDESGYVYDSAYCYECHSNGRS